MKPLLLLLFSLVVPDISSQISGVVVDKSTGYPVQNANVRIENENSATATDDKGLFILRTDYRNKILIISAIGFIPARIKAGSGFMNIALETDVYQVAEAEVAAERIREDLIVDNFLLDSVSDWHCFSAGRQTAAKYFSWDGRLNAPPTISRLIILINNPAPRASFRVNLLNARRNGKPGGEMIENKPERTIIKGKQIITFDLEEYNITYPPWGFVTVVEWTENRQDFVPCIGLTEKAASDGYWVNIRGKWKRVKGSGKAGKGSNVDLAIKLILSE